MLFSISLASLEGPFPGVAFAGGERTGGAAEEFDRTSCEVLVGFSRRLRELWAAASSAGCILPFASRLESACVRREDDSVSRSLVWARRELDVLGGTAVGMLLLLLLFRLRSEVLEC